MAVTAADLKVYLTGGAGNTDKDLSLGGDTSATEVDTGSLNDLFAYVSVDEAAAGSVKYRAFAIKNTSALTLYDVIAWLDSLTVGSTYSSIKIAYDSVGTQTIADEDTAPLGLTFSAPDTKATGIVLGDMATTVEFRIWIERTILAGATILDDSINIYFEGGNAP